MTNSVLIDTDILIDVGHNISDAVSCLQQIEMQASPVISIITQMEMTVGCRDKSELRSLDRFLSRFAMVKVDERTSDIAADLLRRYKLSHGLLIADAFIAASALSRNIPFVTKNQRDFRFVAGLNLLPYPNPLPTTP